MVFDYGVGNAHDQRTHTIDCLDVADFLDIHAF